MSDTDRMVVWLRETLDAAEREGEAAGWCEDAGTWTAKASEYTSKHRSEPRWFIIDSMEDGVITDVDPQASDTEGVARHIARHHPDAVLRRIAADRKLLDLHTTPHTVVELAVEPVGELFCGDCDGPCTHKGEAACTLCGEDGCETMRLLAEGWGWTEETAS